MAYCHEDLESSVLLNAASTGISSFQYSAWNWQAACAAGCIFTLFLNEQHHRCFSLREVRRDHTSNNLEPQNSCHGLQNARFEVAAATGSRHMADVCVVSTGERNNPRCLSWR